MAIVCDFAFSLTFLSALSRSDAHSPARGPYTARRGPLCCGRRCDGSLEDDGQGMAALVCYYDYFVKFLFVWAVFRKKLENGFYSLVFCGKGRSGICSRTLEVLPLP